MAPPAPASAPVSKLQRILDRAVAAYQAGRLTEAEEICQKLVAKKSNFFGGVHVLAVVQNELKKYDLALANYNRAIALEPNNAEALSNRGNTLVFLDRCEEALRDYDRSISLKPQSAITHNSRGYNLFRLKRYDEALASFDRAIALSPRYYEAHYNRANALLELKRFDEAMASCDRALSTRTTADATEVRGRVFSAMRRHEEAISNYERALSIDPDHIDANTNRAAALWSMGRLDEALQACDKAISLQPDFARAHMICSGVSMLKGDVRRGFQEYEWRWGLGEMEGGDRQYRQPLWLGAEDLAGKTILLHSEQGFGDAIQFCRYAPLVAARGANVLVGVREPLHRFLSTLPGSIHVIAPGAPLPHLDFHCPLLSLPHAFDTDLSSIPSQAAYLRPDGAIAAKWNLRLGTKTRPRIGLVWSGNPDHKRDGERSMSFATIAPLMEFDASFVVLQKEIRPDESEAIANSGALLFGKEFSDFADTAALISQLDLVITVDTGVAHVAGAIGTPVWIMVTHIPDWRWMMDRDDSPWYPSARLFRQDATREWPPVVARVRDALSGIADAPLAPRKLDAAPEATPTVSISA
jgi:tetratricopeptide (TPR) repeat protein